MSTNLWVQNRRTMSLAVPIMAGHLGQMLMGLVDTVMVGRIGVVPLAACAFANTVLSVPLVFGFGVLSAVSVRVAHAHGSGREAEAAAALRAGFVVAFLMALPVAIGAHFLLPSIAIFGQPASVNAAVGTYFLLCAWSTLPVFFTSVAKGFCEAYAKPWPPFWIMIAGVLLNAFLNWIFIFGNLGAPALGLDGAGLATLLARIATAVAVIAWPAASGAFGKAWSLRPTGWRRTGSVAATLRIGLPAGGLHLSEVSGFAAGSLMMGWIGVVPLAAHQIAITCAATTFMIPLGLSQAVSVRVGQARGAKRPETITPIITGGLLSAAAMMGCCAVVLILFGREIAGAFTADPAVVVLTGQLLVLAGVFQIFDGVQVVSAGALRGFEDTRVAMLIGIFSYWLVALPISYFAAFSLDRGAPGVWAGFIVGLAVAAALLLRRVIRRCKTLSPTPPLPA